MHDHLRQIFVQLEQGSRTLNADIKRLKQHQAAVDRATIAAMQPRATSKQKPSRKPSTTPIIDKETL